VLLGFAAIDLDNAASIAKSEAAYRKRTSSGYLPPEQAVVECSCRKMGSRKETRMSIAELEAKFEEAKRSGTLDDIISLGNAFKQVKEDMAPSSPSLEILASSKLDMWSFGVLLYYLCTGMQLFNMDTPKDIRDNNLRCLRDWDDVSLCTKLQEIPEGWPRALLESLLQKDPLN
jgi:serine/threonine protein kinase